MAHQKQWEKVDLRSSDVAQIVTLGVAGTQWKTPSALRLTMFSDDSRMRKQQLSTEVHWKNDYRLTRGDEQRSATGETGIAGWGGEGRGGTKGSQDMQVLGEKREGPKRRREVFLNGKHCPKGFLS